jgi:hypothetical protein
LTEGNSAAYKNQEGGIMNITVVCQKAELQHKSAPLEKVGLSDLPEHTLNFERNSDMIVVVDGKQAAVLKNRTGPVGVFPAHTVADVILG